MKSLILTILYLAKDTVHRWFTRLSSPVARVLVVFFLSLCALCFLGSYVISAKAIQDRIRKQGGDLVAATLMGERGKAVCVPRADECEEILDVDSLAVRHLGMAVSLDKKYYRLYTYDFNRSVQFLPLMAASGAPTFFRPTHSPVPAGPATMFVAGEPVDVFVKVVPEDHLLLRLAPEGCIVVPPDRLPPGMQHDRVASSQLILRVRHLESGSSAASLRRVESYLENLARLEGAQVHLISAANLLEQMDIVLGNQTQCRAAFCLGIACIVGILLTALASMEYRQNEYIYTLMKSFGIHPLLLVGSFIMENVVLVGVSFAGAVAVFMHSQRIIVAQFFKMGQYGLTLEEIMPEIQLIAVALLICVLVSSVPILFAANREIGRVLK